MLERELHQLFEHSGDAAFIVAPDGQIRSWNAAAEALFGFSAKEAMHRNCYELLQGRGALGTEVCRHHCDIWNCAARSQVVPNFDLEVKVRSGQRRWVNVSNLFYKDARRGTTWMIHLARDISSEKDREQVVGRLLELTRRLDALPHGRENLTPVAPLSQRQREILQLFAQGKDAAAVAQALGITRQSLRNHLHRINQRLRTHDRLAAVTQAQQRHLI